MSNSASPSDPVQSPAPEAPVKAATEFLHNLSYRRSLLDSQKFSDVTVMAGGDLDNNKKEYKLHRNIICLNSTFFDTACKEGGFRESETRVIQLPEVDPGTFDDIVKWMYSGDYKLESPFDDGRFRSTYDASDYLGMMALRHHLQNLLCDQFTIDAPRVKDYKVIKEPGHLLRQICGSSHVSDMENLQKAACVLYPTRTLQESWLKGLISNEEDETYFLILVVTALQRARMSKPG